MATFVGDMKSIVFYALPGQGYDYFRTDISIDSRFEASGEVGDYFGNFTYQYDADGQVVDVDGVVTGVRYVNYYDISIKEYADIGSISISVDDLLALGGDRVPFLFAGNDRVEGAQTRSGVYDTTELLKGYAGNDTIFGYEGDDTIDGGEGNDLMDGGTGIDTMTGGIGADIYVVDEREDHIVERAGEGYDKVAASTTFSLRGADIEAMTLTGSDAIGAVGNDLNNKLVGNDAGNKMLGETGNDALYGGSGRDALYGGAGNDSFVFDAGLGPSNLDTIYDFANVSGDNDTIRLDDAVFTAFGGTGRIDKTAFARIDSSSAVVSSDAHILYDQASGALFYDADGGTAFGRVQIALLANDAALTFKDFLVI